MLNINQTSSDMISGAQSMPASARGPWALDMPPEDTTDIPISTKLGWNSIRALCRYWSNSRDDFPNWFYDARGCHLSHRLAPINLLITVLESILVTNFVNLRVVTNSLPGRIFKFLSAPRNSIKKVLTGGWRCGWPAFTLSAVSGLQIEGDW